MKEVRKKKEERTPDPKPDDLSSAKRGSENPHGSNSKEMIMGMRSNIIRDGLKRRPKK